MTNEHDGPTHPTPKELGQPEPPVLIFGRDPLTFQEGTKIIGMQTWTDVNQVVNQLINQLVATAEPDPDIKIHFKRPVILEQRFQNHEKDKGFYGRKSTDFEIEMLPTDLSLDRNKRKKEVDPNLTRTIRLSRRIFSSALPKAGELISTACTIVLTDKDVSPIVNPSSGKPKFHYFIGSLGLRDGKGTVLNTIRNSMRNISSVGNNLH